LLVKTAQFELEESELKLTDFDWFKDNKIILYKSRDEIIYNIK
jgi:hypothetical protein